MTRLVHRWIFSLQNPNHILSLIDKLVLLFFGLIAKLFRRGFPVRRFIRANTTPYRPESKCKPLDGESVEILFVSTKKDFRTLPMAVDFAVAACYIFSDISVKIIVPETDILICKEIFMSSGFNIEILNENEIVSATIRETIMNHFRVRGGWVLQQVLKVVYVRDSASNFVLVVDSDTLLIQRRQWVDTEGTQLLFPSWEYHKQYYEFLSQHGIGNIKPEYTFVTHHMLMQPKYMNEALAMLGLQNTLALVNEITLNPFESSNPSPFCIEYELYGQYMSQFFPHKLRIERWGNISVPFEELDPTLETFQSNIANYREFASISSHTYL